MTATVFVIRAMSRNPDLSVMPDRSKIDQTDITQEEEEEEEEEEDDDEEEDNEGDVEDVEDDEEEENDDDDIGEAAEAVAVAVEAPINQKKRGSKSDTKMMTQDKIIAASNPHTAVVSKSPSSSSSSSSSSARGSTDKSKGKLINEQALEVDGEVEGKVVDGDEAVDGCRWVMQRLKGLGSDPRGRKRLHVIRVRAVLTCNCTSYLHRHHNFFFLFVL